MSSYDVNDKVSTNRVEQVQYRWYVVGFMDLLGQAKILRNIDSLPSNEVEFASFIKNVKRTLGTVIPLREHVDRYVEAYTNLKVENPSVDAIYTEALRIATCDTVRVQYFCDTFIVYSSLGGAHAVLRATAMCMLLCFASKQPLRGGIELGLCAEIGPGDMYGPAIAKAYDLERSVAVYPRIVVGNNLFSALKDEIGPVARIKARAALDLIAIDEDKVPFVDFLGTGIANSGSDEEIQRAVKQAFSFVTSEYDRLCQEGDKDLAERYGRLKHYFDSRRNLWPQATG